MEGREPELFNAASSGDEARVQQLLAEGVNPNATDTNWTPLHQAALNNHTGTVQLLLTAGANPNARNRQGETPLHEAAWSGHIETVQALLASGVNPNTQDKLGDTALHDASRLGRSQCVALLLKAGADASVTNDDNQTAEEVAGKDYSVSMADREAVLRHFQDHKGKNKTYGSAILQVSEVLNLDIAASSTATDSASVPIEVGLGGPELRALYDRACAEGYTEVYSTRFVLIGKFGNGKTNLCSSLVGDDFDPEWKITDGIAIHPCVMTQEQQWREIEGQEDNLPQAVADAMKRLKKEDQQEQPTSQSVYTKDQTDPDVLDTTHDDVEKYFFSVKKGVSKDWKDLADCLGLWKEVGNIEGRHRDDESRCRDLLEVWKTQKGDAATMEVLMEALSEAGLQHVVDDIKGKCPKTGK
ncbi:uncharacterized protein LOC144879226 [Branchiostoma floridae x Branchiostoma japonicum]